MKSNIDELIDQYIKEDIQNSPKPLLSSEEAWENISKALDEEPNRVNKVNFKSLFNRKMLYIASFAIFIISAFLINTPNGSAFSKLTQFFQNTQGNITQLFTRVSDPNQINEGAPNPNELSIIEDSETSTLKVSLQEAKDIASFPIRVPKELPKEIVLDNVTIIKKSNTGKSDRIYLKYKGNEQSFTINEMVVEEDTGKGLLIDNEDTNVEEIMIYDRNANLLTYKNGITELFWIENNYYYSIEGNLSKEEIIKIAKSMY